MGCRKDTFLVNRFRRLLTRWEKKIGIYKAMVYFSCEWITLKEAGILIGSN